MTHQSVYKQDKENRKIQAFVRPQHMSPSSQREVLVLVLLREFWCF